MELEVAGTVLFRTLDDTRAAVPDSLLSIGITSCCGGGCWLMEKNDDEQG